MLQKTHYQVLLPSLPLAFPIYQAPLSHPFLGFASLMYRILAGLKVSWSSLELKGDPHCKPSVAPAETYDSSVGSQPRCIVPKLIHCKSSKALTRWQCSGWRSASFSGHRLYSRLHSVKALFIMISRSRNGERPLTPSAKATGFSSLRQATCLSLCRV
jgi:hypothetical protein